MTCGRRRHGLLDVVLQRYVDRIYLRYKLMDYNAARAVIENGATEEEGAELPDTEICSEGMRRYYLICTCSATT